MLNNKYLKYFYLLLLLFLSASCVSNRVNIKLVDNDTVLKKLYHNSQNSSLEILRNKTQQQSLLCSYDLTKKMCDNSNNDETDTFKQMYNSVIDFSINTTKSLLVFTARLSVCISINLLIMALVASLGGNGGSVELVGCF